MRAHKKKRLKNAFVSGSDAAEVCGGGIVGNGRAVRQRKVQGASEGWKTL